MGKTPKRKRNSESSVTPGVLKHRKSEQDGSDHLEVTGVSRSGRVRKKSSKLTDFESPDEIYPRYRRRVKRDTSISSKGRMQSQHVASAAVSAVDSTLVHGHQQGRVMHDTSSMNASQSEKYGKEKEKTEVKEHHKRTSKGPESSFESVSKTGTLIFNTTSLLSYIKEELEIVEDEPPTPIRQEPESSMESDSEAGMFPHEGATTKDFSSVYLRCNTEKEGKEDKEDNVTGEDMGVSQRMRNKDSDTAVSRGTSLYVLERSSQNKLIVRDGKVVGWIKDQRKKKGKKRLSSYTLWAKDVRQEILSVNPDMDFITINKKLAELWANVPTNIKYNLKRKAKRLTSTANHTIISVIDTDCLKSQSAQNQFKQSSR